MTLLGTIFFVFFLSCLAEPEWLSKGIKPGLLVATSITPNLEPKKKKKKGIQFNIRHCFLR